MLVLVPHVVAGTRLLDLLPLVERDDRVQVVFTIPGTLERWHGTEEFVRAQEGLVLPWHQVMQHRFDLALAASRSDVDQVEAPVLWSPHGAGCVRPRLKSPAAESHADPVHALDRQSLMRDGRVVASALALCHDEEYALLRESCPEALDRAKVVGDLCLDRMVASKPNRPAYRQALGVADHQDLVVVSSTWWTDSVFGGLPQLYRRLLGELPADRYRVAAVLHPNIWAVHGRRQVRAWMADSIERGLLLVPPEEGWRATMLAADVLIGDHGSTTRYGAAVGVPTLLGTFPAQGIRPDGDADLLSNRCGRLDLAGDLRDQLVGATTVRDTTLPDRLSAMLTARPGKSADLLRALMYELLGLAVPESGARLDPLPIPVPIV
ncbi:hypothetical protein OOZ19_14630 [Saccharopolyspora sp. NFXS83]|uniref:hypothetical protein n=1 Tax=Saccharopolyspora sp. NFXS83 TaxID=2993560 RepID=UPI00224A99D3|nr:hypothetical protein [Saccharopolyspora sp. NFXS83]MCX2731478.1 hypothetical protein [Saccharopolyspora sp. NFXS83]